MREHLYVGKQSPIQTIPLKTQYMDKQLRFCEFTLFLSTKAAQKIEKFLWNNDFQVLNIILLPNEKQKTSICIIYEEKNRFFTAVEYFSKDHTLDYVNFNNEQDMEEVEWILNQNTHDKKVIKLRHDYFSAKSQGECYSMLSILKTLKYLLTK